jgi:hypothetical protein
VLAGAKHRLLRLDEPDSDAHALVVVPASALPEIERLAAELQRPVVPVR